MKTKLLIAAALVALPLVAVADATTEAVKNGFIKANDAMMPVMHMEPTGNADKDFVAMMIPHHQGAIEMAKVELEYGHDEKLKALATDIIAAQEKEIAAMKAWQRANPKSRKPVNEPPLATLSSMSLWEDAMADLKFEVHILEKSGATAVIEAKTREAAEDIATRIRRDSGVKVSIIETTALEKTTPNDVVPPLV